VIIELFHLGPGGEREAMPYFKRIVSSKETKRLSINGFGGSDAFDIDPSIKHIKVDTSNKEEAVPALKRS